MNKQLSGGRVKNSCRHNAKGDSERSGVNFPGKQNCGEEYISENTEGRMKKICTFC